MARVMPNLSRRTLLASAAATAMPARPSPQTAATARAPVISTAPARPSPAVIGDAWLRDGQAWTFTASGWTRRA
jgi:hypothetical protein